MYGEGGNHFIHTIRRNPSITHLVHDNMVYGLTKGQASPTSQLGFRTPVQVDGVSEAPFNPVAAAVALGASFVARAFCGDRQQTGEIMKQAVTHGGYALVDIFQPCVTYNKVNTFQWFKENTYYVDDQHDRTDPAAAFARATAHGKLALGILYVDEGKPVFEANLPAYRDGRDAPLFRRTVDPDRLRELVDSFRT
jgi:2-oxoglutarate ferredoxin oxidoreductase subunit beta